MKVKPKYYECGIGMSQLAVIPFSGFYDSWHDQMLDDAMDQMFSNDQGSINTNIRWRASDACNWKKVHEKYAKEYAETFGQWLNIPSLEFDELRSPREYIFTTDRIFVRISSEDVKKIWDRVDIAVFAKVCRQMFLSRSGFSSFYDPDWRTWGELEELDHNQLGALLEALAEVGGDWDEARALEWARDNGQFDNWIYDAMKEPERSRLFKIHDYLRKREAR